MSSYMIEVEKTRMLFPTQVSPFIFKDSRELVQEMLEEANKKTEIDRKIVEDYVSTLSSGWNMCFFIFASALIVPLPFYCCYFCGKQGKMMKSSKNLIGIWEKVAERYNERLIEKGLYVRLIQNSSPVVYGDSVQSNTNYYYEFTFRNGMNMNNNENNDLNENGNFPPPVFPNRIVENSK